HAVNLDGLQHEMDGAVADDTAQQRDHGELQAAPAVEPVDLGPEELLPERGVARFDRNQLVEHAAQAGITGRVAQGTVQREVEQLVENERATERGRRQRRFSRTADTGCSLPSRSTMTSTRSPARWPRSAKVRSSSVFTSTPANLTMMSPARTPAFSAGLPGRTPVIFTPGLSASPKSGITPKKGP